MIVMTSDNSVDFDDDVDDDDHDERAVRIK